MSDERVGHCPDSTASRVVSVSQLKESRCGTVRGHVTGTANKTTLYDSSDKIELVLFGEMPLKPDVLYELKVEEFVFVRILAVSLIMVI